MSISILFGLSLLCLCGNSLLVTGFVIIPLSNLEIFCIESQDRINPFIENAFKMVHPTRDMTFATRMTAIDGEENLDYNEETATGMECDDSYCRDEHSSTDVSDFGEEDLEVAGVVIEELSWRVNKLRLEEANTRRFLKAGPRFLPYEECRKWVQAWGRWKTQDDW